MPPTTPARILTVEDDPIVRADLRLILEEHGFEVVADARDGVEAVELAREHRPDLILIDLNLPELDGVAATRLILDEREVPIVALTGYVAGDLLERAVEAGAVEHLTKPFSAAALVDTLRNVLVAWRLDEAKRDAHRDGIRVTIEAMVRENRSEAEIVAVVHSLTGEPTPARELSNLRRIFARLAGRPSAE